MYCLMFLWAIAFFSGLLHPALLIRDNLSLKMFFSNHKLKCSWTESDFLTLQINTDNKKQKPFIGCGLKRSVINSASNAIHVFSVSPCSFFSRQQQTQNHTIRERPCDIFCNIKASSFLLLTCLWVNSPVLFSPSFHISTDDVLYIDIPKCRLNLSSQSVHTSAQLAFCSWLTLSVLLILSPDIDDKGKRLFLCLLPLINSLLLATCL